MSRSELLLESVNSFYSDPKNCEYLENILDKKINVSLRRLEWFITDYSKRNNTIYKTTNGKIFPVHCSYKSSLDGYSKKLFDPFCRTNKFEFVIPSNGHKIQTTVAQLNFIKWCIQNNIIEYIIENSSLLDSHK